MATRSYIAKQNSNDTIAYIYCHFDGYLEGVGKTLFTHYTDETVIDKLMGLGGIRSLDTSPDTIVDYPDDETTIVKDEQELIEHFKDSWCDYCYLFKNNEWHVLHDGQFELLAQHLLFGENE